MKAKPRGVPAAAVLANGITRHGRHCACRFCREEYSQPTPPAGLADLLTCDLAAFCAVVVALASGVERRFGARKVYISALWSAVDAAGYRIRLDLFKRRLVAGRAAGLLELARADLVAAMPTQLVADSATLDLGAEYHFVVDPSARDPWEVDASPIVARIPVIGAAS